MPLDARQLAARIVPTLIAQLEARKPEILAEAGGPLARTIERIAWPKLIRQLPLIAEAGIEALAQEFGHLTLDEIAASVFAIRQSALARRPPGGP